MTASILNSIIIGAAFNPLYGIWYLAQCAIIGLMLPELTLKGVRPSSSVIWTASAAILLSALVAFIMASVEGHSLFDMARKEITTAVDQAIRFYEQQKGISKPDMEAIRQGMKKIGEIMLRLYPALASMNLLLISGLNMFILSKMAMRWNLPVEIPPFTSFRAPEMLIWPLLAAGFAMLSPTTIVTTPAMNILALLILVYLFQGIAVVAEITRRSAYKSTIRMGLIILLIIQPYIVPILAIIGVFDLWGDFRTPRLKQDENL